VQEDYWDDIDAEIEGTLNLTGLDPEDPCE